MMIWLKILGAKKREDDLYHDLIEDLGIKNDKNIFFFIPQSVAMRFL